MHNSCADLCARAAFQFYQTSRDVCAPFFQNLDIYIYKHSIKTTDIGLTAVIADSPTKFEIWFRKRKPGDTYTLQCASEDIKKAWTEELSNLLWKQALRNRGDSSLLLRSSRKSSRSQ